MNFRTLSVALLALLLCSCQSRIVFQPSYATNRLSPAALHTLRPQPVEVPLAASFGWRFDSPEADHAILMFHGNAETVDDYASWATSIARSGRTVLLVEYPGFRESSGKPTENSIRRVGTAAFDSLRKAGFDENKITVFGRSIGAAAACDLTTQRKVKKLILVSPFTSLAAMARANRLPKVAALGRFDNLTAIKKYHGELLVIHGRTDRVVPFEMGATLLSEAASPPSKKSFLPLEAGHNDLLSNHESIITNRITTMR